MPSVKVSKVVALVLVICLAQALFLQALAFAEATTAPQLSGASISPGSIPGTTKVTGTTIGAGDHLVYQVVAKATLTPNAGAAAPAAALYYAPGTNIAGVDAANKKYVDIYEVDPFGKIVKFQEFTASLPQAAAAVSVTVAPGSVPLSTKVTATAGSGHALAYKVVSSQTKAAPVTGAFLPAGAQAYTSGADIIGVDLVKNKYVDIYEYDGGGQVVGFTEITLSAANNILAPALKKDPVVVKGKSPSSTKLTVVPTKAGNTFQTVLVILDPQGKSPIKAPAIGDSLPVLKDEMGMLPMSVMTDLVPLDKTGEVSGTSPGAQICVYEVDASKKIVTFTTVNLTSTVVSIPSLNAAPTVAAGTAAGSTSITATVNMPGVGTIPSDKLVYKIVSKPTTAQPGYDLTLPSDAKAMSSGSATTITGVDLTTNKYVDIYEYSDWLDTTIVYAFKEIALDTTSIRANDATASAAPGKTAGTTKLTLTPAKTGNKFVVSIGTSAADAPTLGSAAPSGTAAYTSGADLKGVDETAKKYVNVYELSGGKVAGFKALTLTGANISAPVLTATAAAGSASGTAKVTASASSGNSLSIKVVSAATALPAIGDALPSGTTDSYAAGSDITGVDAKTSKYVDVYEVDGDGKVVKFKEILLTAAQIKK